MQRVILLIGLLTLGTLVAAQANSGAVPSEVVTPFPFLPPMVSTPVVILPSDIYGGLGVIVGQYPVGPPLLVIPSYGIGSYGIRDNSYAVGASNATLGNLAGATNATIGSQLEVFKPGYREHLQIAPSGVFNTGAAVYLPASGSDLRNLGQLTAELRKQPRPSVRVYTNADIEKLKQSPPRAQTPNQPQQ